VYAHGWLPLKTTLPPVRGHCVRFAVSVVALMPAQGYVYWLAGAWNESPRHTGWRRRKCAVALPARAVRATSVESIARIGDGTELQRIKDWFLRERRGEKCSSNNLRANYFNLSRPCPLLYTCSSFSRILLPNAMEAEGVMQTNKCRTWLSNRVPSKPRWCL
jgi:hypothetical protein